MRDQLVGLFERAFIEQELDALAGRHLALLVLLLAAPFAAAFFGQLVASLQFLQFLFQIHRPQIIGELAFGNPVMYKRVTLAFPRLD